MLRYEQLLLVAFMLRLCLVVYGTYQDEWFEVKYSDVDYAVVTDGSRFVLEGKSPYARDTYRYSPILAYLLTPNIVLHSSFGKLLFCAFDFVGARVTRNLALEMGLTPQRSEWSELLYLYNPLSLGISTRGSGDSIICAMVLGIIWGLVKLQKQQQGAGASVLFATALLHGFAVHWRLFPIIFAPTILLILKTWRERILFGLVSATCFFALLAGFYAIYGMQFVWETFLYHAARTDPKHNFSVWFYAIYLQANGTSAISALSQILVQGMVIWTFRKFPPSASSRGNVLHCFLLQTWAFVAFNKVVTAQYFLWYFALLPIVFMEQAAKQSRLLPLALRVLVPWTLTELVWLAAAYRIEFLGQSSAFELVFLASLFFFAANMYSICTLLGAARLEEEKGNDVKVE